MFLRSFKKLNNYHTACVINKLIGYKHMVNVAGNQTTADGVKLVVLYCPDWTIDDHLQLLDTNKQYYDLIHSFTLEE